MADSRECLTYGQVRQLADHATDSVTREDLVAVECDNSVSSIVAYIGCIQKGIPVLLVDKSLVEAKKNVLYGLYNVSVVISATKSSRIANRGPKMHPDLALLLSTSGSTGSPKLVRLTRNNVESNARQICKYLNLHASNRAITTLPQQYSFGLSIINSHFYAGGSIALTNKSIAERGFWDFFNEYQADSISGVPAIYDILRKIRFERMSLPSLKTMTQAGGRLSSDAVRFFADLGKRKGFGFLVMYGQTEATARMSFLPSDEAVLRSDSIGVAIPEGRFEIQDPDGSRLVESGRVGELVYYGPNVMMGYANDAHDLSLGDTQHGILRTGDLAEMDEYGYYYIRGRLKRFLKLFGNRVNLDEVEKDLRAEGFDIYVSGKDELLLIAGVNNREIDQAASIFSSRFHFHPSVVKKMLLDQIPRNESGKVQYGQILYLYETKIGSS